MKRKELKNLANKIAKLEQIIQRNEDPKQVQQVQQAKDEIMKLSGHVDSLEDIMLMDELIQDILKNS